jgi:hypothetical protein
MDGNNSHQFKTVDIGTNSVIANHLEIDPAKARYLHVHSAGHFSRAFDREDGIYFFNIFDDLIYKCTNGELQPVFRMNLNHRNIPSSFYGGDYSDVSVFFQALFKGDYAYGTDLFVEYEKDRLYSYFYGGERHLSLISKATREATLDFKTLIEDAVLSDYPVNLTEQSFFIQENSELILPLDPSEIVEYAKNHPDEAVRQNLQQRIRYVDEDPNPVLLMLNR